VWEDGQKMDGHVRCFKEGARAYNRKLQRHDDEWHVKVNVEILPN
jgi:hypothetical protein